jgi:hypothetical protein
MYRAKDAGKNVYQFFAAEMGKQQQQQMALETRLRWAVKNEELAFKFQPKVEIRTGRIVGAEALLRWRDPLLGTSRRRASFPLAEESGLIDALGDWVLNQACRESKKWADGARGLTIAINLSVRQFRDAEFAARSRRSSRYRLRSAPGRVRGDRDQRAVRHRDGQPRAADRARAGRARRDRRFRDRLFEPRPPEAAADRHR